MTVFNTGPQATTADFLPGDIGYVQKSLGHYVENTGTTDLTFVAVSRRISMRKSRSPIGSRIRRRRWWRRR